MAEVDEIERNEGNLRHITASEIDPAANQKKKKKKKKKHNIRKLMKVPMVLPHTLLEFMDGDCREGAIRFLSTFLIEKREEDLDNYYRAGFFVLNSFGTMTVLIQEVVAFYGKMAMETYDVRSIKRLANVLTIFQCLAANRETRQQFIDTYVPNLLIPLILHKSTLEVFDIVNAVSLSVIAILCQGREPTIIKWGIETQMVEVCSSLIWTGSELAKVIAMHILEAMLHDKFGIKYICSPTCDHLLKGLIRAWDEQVNLMAQDEETSPQLLFHIIRCYIVLCTNSRGYNIVKKNLPEAIMSNSFQDMIKEFPVIRNLLDQLHMIMAR